MQAVSNTIYSRLNGDSTLAALLGSFDGAASIFTKRPVPQDATKPVVIASDVVVDSPEDQVKSIGRVHDRDIMIVGKDASHFDKVIDAAERVRFLFHRQKQLVVAGYHVLSVIARGPVEGPAEPGDIARIVTVSFRLRET